MLVDSASTGKNGIFITTRFPYADYYYDLQEISDLIASITLHILLILNHLILKINPFIILSALSYFIDSKINYFPIF